MKLDFRFVLSSIENGGTSGGTSGVSRALPSEMAAGMVIAVRPYASPGS